MRALLTLFMVAPAAAGGLGFKTATAGSIYGTYTMTRPARGTGRVHRRSIILAMAMCV